MVDGMRLCVACGGRLCLQVSDVALAARRGVVVCAGCGSRSLWAWWAQEVVAFACLGKEGAGE